MVLDDAAHNGESQSCAALLGGEVRQEELLFDCWRDAMARIGNGNLHRIAPPYQSGLNHNLLYHRLLHRLGCVVHEVGNGTPDGVGIGIDRRQIVGEELLHSYATQPPIEHE